MKLHYLFLAFLLQCSVYSFGQTADALEQIIDSVRRNYVPDKRVAVYDITARKSGDVPILTGNISDGKIHQELLLALHDAGIVVMDSIRILPEHTIGAKHWGIVPLSAIYIRKAPSFQSEIVTQALLGTPVKILDKKKGWSLIQTPDQYIGWTDTRIAGIDRKELAETYLLPKVIVVRSHTLLYARPSLKANPVMEVLMGNVLTLEGTKINGRFVRVSLPDGTMGYILSQTVKKFSDWLQSVQLTGNSVVQLGEQFIGLPYLWGGACSRGMDCSGFTKTVFFMHGLILPRDASQQFYSGEKVDIKRGWENLKKGDLLFFGSRSDENSNVPYRITHVAISMGGAQFIHSAGKVKINSLNPSDPNYDEYNSARFVGARRIIGVSPAHVWRIAEHEWYVGSVR